MPDPRSAKGKQYAIEELLMSGIGMFLFKEGSRNPFNNHRMDSHFSAHYHQMFGSRLPHQDTLSDVLGEVDVSHLEEVRMNLMSELFEQKHSSEIHYPLDRNPTRTL